MNGIVRTFGGMATGFSSIVIGLIFVPMILVAVVIGRASFFTDCLHQKRNLQNCSALVARSQGVPQS